MRCEIFYEFSKNAETIYIFCLFFLPYLYLICLQPSDIESEEESDDDTEYSEASEDIDSEGTLLMKVFY